MAKRILVGALCALGVALALALNGSSVSAQQPPPCDFVTGGGSIVPVPATGQKGTFGAAGGCRNASAFGHLEFDDHGLGLKVHWTSITAYNDDPSDANARLICGTATTNTANSCAAAVNFVVRAKDGGEPGSGDQFDIQLTNQSDNVVCYTTFPGGPHNLGGGTGGGGNIMLHKPNNVTFGSCSAPGTTATLSVFLTSTGAPVNGVFPGGTVTSNPGTINCSINTSTGAQMGTCSDSFAPGTVTLLAQANTGVIASFTAGCDTPPPDSPAGGQTTCTVTMGTTNKQVSASFRFSE